MSKAPAKKPPVPLGVEIFDVEQNTPEWFALRLGVPTASNFGKIMVQNAERKGRAKLLRQLAGEIITGVPAENFKSAAMDRGNAMEAALRDQYEQSAFNVTRVGFVRNGKFGCSPDCLVGEDGGAEFKSMAPDLMIELIEQGSPLPTEHRAQIQGNMMVTERKWWDLVIGYTGMPPLKWRLLRDEAYIASLRKELNEFELDLRRLVERVRGLAK